MFSAIVLALLLQTAPAAAAAPPQDPAPKQEEPGIITVGKSKLKFYGFLRLDAVYDTDRPNNTQIPGFILSEDLSTAGGESDFTMHPRLTRLGMDFEGPTVEELGGAKVTGKLEVDFYNVVAGASNSREFLRMRHAWGKLAWTNFSLLAGQREDVISPLAPTPNNDLVMWGAGNLGDRRPQIRPEYKIDALTLTGMIGLTGAVDNSDLDGNGFLDGEASSVPTLQARVAYEIDGWVEKKKVISGVWFHWAQEEADGAFAGEDEWDSNAVGLDVTVPLHEKVWLKAEAWLGENLDDVRGGIFQGVAPNGDEVPSKGGWVEVGFQATPWWMPVVGASMDDPDDDDLPAAGRDRNLVFWIANRLKFGPVEFGVDWLLWKTEYAGSGIDDGTDNRFAFFMAYNF